MKEKYLNLLYRISQSRFGRYLPDKWYLKILFLKRIGKPLNLSCPVTFNEKLQWLKLYDRRPEYTIMVDKLAVKQYVKGIIGDSFIIPTIGVWDNAEDIEWDLLPNQFVLKCTHDSGGLVICRDKNKLDKAAAVSKLNKCLARDYYNYGREWPYKNVPHRIIAEVFIEPDLQTNDLPDYKFFCFDGEIKALFVATDRHNPATKVKKDFYDADFKLLPLRWGSDNSNHPIAKPKCFEIMKNAAAKLSKGIPHVRVDFYETNGRVLFGEMTFFHDSGFMPFQPDIWDKKFGDMIVLPKR